MQSPGDICTFGSIGAAGRDWISCPVGEGNFTVEEDRLALGRVLEQLIRTTLIAAKLASE